MVVAGDASSSDELHAAMTRTMVAIGATALNCRQPLRLWLFMMVRFASANHYASYNGTAPIEVSSGGKKRHRLSMRGNRVLNHAIHMAAVTQIRHDTPGRIYYDKKQAEGKTKKEALRALKRRVSDTVYQQLIADHG